MLVTTAGLGTVNTTALTLEALDRAGLRLQALVVGSWPAEPDLAPQRDLDAAAIHDALAGYADEAAPVEQGEEEHVTEFAQVLGERLRAARAAARLARLVGAHDLAAAHEADGDALGRLGRAHGLSLPGAPESRRASLT